MQATKSHNQIPHKHRFTLVELMVVLIIIGIMLAALAPAFNRLMTGNAVGAAARMVSSQLRLARSEAVSRRQYIAIIMPGNTFTPPASDTTSPYKYQSFRAAVVTHSSGTYTFDKWVEGTVWTFLPLGAVIAEADTDGYMSGSLPVPTGTDWVELIADADFKLEIPVDSNGTSKWKIEDHSALVVTGIPPAPLEEVRAVIFTPNGRCAQKTFVTILEGVAPNGTIERENKNNIRVMEINAFTGQIRYLF
jgi:prepilin-type N-terminal cleavage/methylation domain-containing protein